MPSSRKQRVTDDWATHWSGFAAVGLSALLFGTLAIFGKYAQQEHLTIATLLGLRFLIAAVVLWAIVGVRRELRWPGMRRVAQLGFLSILFVGQSACYFLSLRTAPAAVTSILLYIYPVVVTMLGWLLYRERLSVRSGVSLVVATCGVALVIGITPSGHLDTAGIVFGVGAGLLYSLYIVIGERVLHATSALFTMAAVSSGAAATFLVFGAVTRSLAAFDAVGWVTVLGAALLPTVVGATLFLFGVARVGPTRASILSTVEPVATGSLAAILLAERLSPLRILGGAAVLGAASLVASGRRAPLSRATQVAP